MVGPQPAGEFPGGHQQPRRRLRHGDQSLLSLDANVLAAHPLPAWEGVGHSLRSSYACFTKGIGNIRAPRGSVKAFLPLLTLALATVSPGEVRAAATPGTSFGPQANPGTRSLPWTAACGTRSSPKAWASDRRSMTRWWSTTGTLADGTVFDSSFERGGPATLRSRVSSRAARGLRSCRWGRSGDHHPPRAGLRRSRHGPARPAERTLIY